MALLPNNNLVQVQTWQKAQLAFLQNSFYGIDVCNKKFNNFQDFVANLGQTVSYDAPPRFRAFPGLTVTEQPSVQRIETLTCAQSQNTTTTYNDQQFMFNVDEYMDRFGRAAVMALGSKIESDILLNIIGQMEVQDPDASTFGTVYTNNGGFRFYGNGINPISSFQQLAQMIANFNDFGASPYNLRCVLPVTAIPSIVGTGLNEFAPERNNELARSWKLGTYANCEFHSSNLLPLHVAGTIGNAAYPNNVLTVVSTNDPTGQNVTQITCTEPTGGTDANAIKLGDMGVFNDGVAGLPNMRFLNFGAYTPSNQPVQFFVTANAGTTAGTVTLTIRTINGVGLVWASNQNQNLNNAIQAGMKITIQPTHRAGMIDSGDQWYLAMPKLPAVSPYESSVMQDEVSGASFRHYYGSGLGNNIRRYIQDCIYGVGLLPDNCMRVLLPA